jgi:hypothetical protein
MYLIYKLCRDTWYFASLCLPTPVVASATTCSAEQPTLGRTPLIVLTECKCKRTFKIQGHYCHHTDSTVVTFQQHHKLPVRPLAAAARNITHPESCSPQWIMLICSTRTQTPTVQMLQQSQPVAGRDNLHKKRVHYFQKFNRLQLLLFHTQRLTSCHNRNIQWRLVISHTERAVSRYKLNQWRLLRLQKHTDQTAVTIDTTVAARNIHHKKERLSQVTSGGWCRSTHRKPITTKSVAATQEWLLDTLYNHWRLQMSSIEQVAVSQHMTGFGTYHVGSLHSVADI